MSPPVNTEQAWLTSTSLGYVQAERPDLLLPCKSHREINPAGHSSTESPTKDRLSRRASERAEALQRPPSTARTWPGHTAVFSWALFLWVSLHRERGLIMKEGAGTDLDLIPVWLWVYLGCRPAARSRVTPVPGTAPGADCWTPKGRWEECPVCWHSAERYSHICHSHISSWHILAANVDAGI